MEKVFMIALTPTMEDGKIVKWHKKVSDSIQQGEVICEVETDKSSMEYESLNEGTILKIFVEEGDSAKIGDIIAIVGEAGEDISSVEAEIASQASTTDTSSKSKDDVQSKQDTPSKVAEKSSVASGGRVIISPLAKKIASQNNVNVQTIQGSGTNGRIVKRDVEGAIENQQTVTSQHTPHAGVDVTIPVTGVRGVIAKRLSESKFSAPHFYLKNTIRTEKVVALRNAINAQRQKEKKSKISMNACFIKFVAEALKQNPAVNSSWQEKEIIQFGSVDIGLAVDLGNGLITPIVRNCAYKGIISIDDELQILIEKVRSGSISSNEYTGATFTISNLGSFGVDEFTAIINPPGAGILAIGQNKQIPVISESGTIEVGSAMTVTLSCDHRVVDGAVAAKFLATLKNLFENPAMALL